MNTKQRKPIVAAILCAAVAAPNLVSAGPFYSITTIGLTDAEHTRDDGYVNNYVSALNNSGQVVGTADRWDGATYMGQSAWLYNGASTVTIGLTDTEHTGNDGYQVNDVSALNNAGQAVGFAYRFNGATDMGVSAWLYNGASTVAIGLTDAEHTRNDGYQVNFTAYALNDAGQTVGTANRYDGATDIGISAWLYNGTSTVAIGLTDAGHTNNDGYQDNEVYVLNNAGHALGSAKRFNGAADLGYSAWLYNGTSTVTIGLTDAGHTRNDGYQYNFTSAWNNAGQVAGAANRFNGATDMGRSAWLYNGTSTVTVGLIDTAHTANDGYQFNNISALNNVGQAVGTATRFDGATDMGRSAWLYDGTGTVTIGLADAEHTRNDGYQYNDVYALNDAGQALGSANRFNGGATYTGRSAWLHNGTSTVVIGLTDAAHTSSDGVQENLSYNLNEAGQAVGFAERYNGASDTGRTAWFYDAATGQTYGKDFSIRSTDGYASSQFNYLGDDGLGLGEYSLFDSAGNYLREDAFSFTVSDGFQDLGSLIDGGLDNAGWLSLAAAIRGNSAGQIVGTGLLNGMTADSSAAFLLTPETTAVPVPPAVWLLSSGLVCLIGTARRKNAA